jgi:hypothetical protein
MARKKHLAKTSLEVRAQALKPPTADRLCEIAEEIVDQLRPWKEREAAVMELVGMELHLVLCIAPLEATRCADLTVNRTHAQRLDRVLRSVEELIATAPIPLRQFLIDPHPTLGTDDWPLPYPVPTGEIARKNAERADFFRSELKRMREVCSRALSEGLGYHPNYDPVKRYCAMVAYNLMGVSKQNITSTKDSPFRAIVSLLYEAVSGQRDADLKRACVAGIG